MAYAMTKQGSLDNCITYEFICDTIEDMNAIENRYRTIGTIAIVLSGNSGLEVYIAGSDKQWNSLSTIGGSSGAGSAGLAIHICGQNEVSEGLPNVSEPDETTIYLVPAEDEQSGNLYDEYIYVDNDWERFGSGSTIDLTGYYQKPVNGIPASDLASGVIPDTSVFAPKANPVFTGSISLGREGDTTVGNASFAVGIGVEASGNFAHAEGSGTTASGSQSHAEGAGTVASGSNSHAEGGGVVASGDLSHAEGANTNATNFCAHAEGAGTTASGWNSHAEGSNTTASNTGSHAEGSGTTASGNNSHAEGSGTTASGIISHAEGSNTIASGVISHAAGANTIASGAYQCVCGMFNVEDSYVNWPEWTASTSYAVGDKVKVTTTSDNNTTITGYICKTANNDSSFVSSKWIGQGGKMNYIETVGNGEQESARSNARALDWDGNEYLMGDIYVGCNADSTGGTKVVTEAVLASLINRIATLESKVAYLEGQHVPDAAVTDETGAQITDESSNFITYNN